MMLAADREVDCESHSGPRFAMLSSVVFSVPIRAYLPSCFPIWLLLLASLSRVLFSFLGGGDPLCRSSLTPPCNILLVWASAPWFDWPAGMVDLLWRQDLGFGRLLMCGCVLKLGWAWLLLLSEFVLIWARLHCGSMIGWGLGFGLGLCLDP